VAVGRTNPFKPTAGATPPLLIGRQTLLDDFALSLHDGPGSSGRLTIFTGARGVGKTVMLTEVGDVARPLGWVVIDETATPGLLDRLRTAVTTALGHLDAAPPTGRSVTGITVAAVGAVQWAPPPEPREVLLRQALDDLLGALEPHRTGLLITIDEVHRGVRDDLRDLAATFQHLVRARRDVAVALAGLPSAVSELLNDDVLTFLRRADQHVLGDLALPEVRSAFADTITANSPMSTGATSPPWLRTTGRPGRRTSPRDSAAPRTTRASTGPGSSPPG
jgi:hypothetical protein